MNRPEVITEPLGGSALAVAAVAGTAPAGWYERRPRGERGWKKRASEVRGSVSPQWLDAIRPAINATGAAAERLDAVAGGKGVVVTTGQQPGLFGGPMYTMSKALTALTIADSLGSAIGMPVAPVFWAATDDSDFAEASWTMVARRGGVDELRMRANSTALSMSDMPLGDVSDLIHRFEQGAGSAAFVGPLALVRRAYRHGQTVGGAYLELLRAMLEPLGIAVLDAAHPAVRRAGSPLLREALRRCERIAADLVDRDREIVASGFSPQVAAVPGLSLVFRSTGAGRERIRLVEAPGVAEAAQAETLSPNVLLRPVMERAILPTIAYAAGPGELAYFAQVGAVAGSLDASLPLAVPRWSCTILEPHVREILVKLDIERDDLRDPHRVETLIATAGLPEGVRGAFARMTAALDEGLAELERSGTSLVGPEPIEGARRSLGARLARLHRRYTAAMKRHLDGMLQHVATARGSLFPAGKRQERALNLIPLLARHGEPLLEEMQREARIHADALVRGSGGVEMSAHHPQRAPTAR